MTDQINKESLSIPQKVILKIYELSRFVEDINQEALMDEALFLLVVGYILTKKEFIHKVEGIFQKPYDVTTNEEKKYKDIMTELYDLMYEK